MAISPLPFPRRINVELTNHCNQRCVLCPRQEFTRPLGFMSEAIFQRIALECAGWPTVLWLHFLGEPLLHKHVVSFIRFAKQVGVTQVGLSTNAVSLSSQRAEGLLDSGLDRLECSMDAMNRIDYLAMRGRDHFDRVLGNVRAFLEKKRLRGTDRPLTSIQFMRTPALEAVLKDVVDAWRSLLGPRDFVMTIEPSSFGGAIALGNQVVPAERSPCAWLFESLVILQDGTVTMCATDWDARSPLGHLQDGSIAEIWNGPEAQRRRAAHLRGDFAAISPCARCVDWRLADGHGYVNALNEVNGIADA